ncbi:MAG: cupin domain-containing protein [Bacteroidota bacterium]
MRVRPAHSICYQYVFPGSTKNRFVAITCISLGQPGSKERRYTDTKTVMEGSTTSLSLFEVHTSTLEPGKAPHTSHTHADQEELIIVKEGRVKITITSTSKIMGPGVSLMLFPVMNMALKMPATHRLLTMYSNTNQNYDEPGTG